MKRVSTEWVKHKTAASLMRRRRWDSAARRGVPLFPAPPLASIRVIGLANLSRHSIPPSLHVDSPSFGCALCDDDDLHNLMIAKRIVLSRREAEWRTRGGGRCLSCRVNYNISLIWCGWLDVCTSHDRRHKLNTRPDICQYINHFSCHLPNLLLVCLVWMLNR